MNEINKLDLVSTHNLNLKDRKYLELSGVKVIESFDSQEFLMETNQGWLSIKGNELSLAKLDTENGFVIIKGFIISLEYLNKKNNEKESFIAKLFK